MWKKEKQQVQQVPPKTQVTGPVQQVQQATLKERVKAHIAQVQKSLPTKDRLLYQARNKRQWKIIVSNSGNKESGIELNPELCELKRQLFEGFEQMNRTFEA